MKQFSELNKILGDFLNWHKSRLDCFTRMLFALFAVRTINLREIAVGFSSNAEIDSRHKRCKRFFAKFTINFDVIARWIFTLFFCDIKKLYITIDRTNWFFGKSKINILTLGVAYEGVAIPLVWNLLDKAGNATGKEHKAIIERFVSLFGKDCIEGVLGDREFASGELFEWLNLEKIPFYIRIKEDSIIHVKKKKICTAEKAFNDVNRRKTKVFPMSIWLYGQKVYLAGSRSQGGELMIVATNQDAKNAISIYLRRWEIECLFSCLKTKGFRFEDTHITKLERIEKLIVLLAIGFCWAHKIGEWRATQKPIKFNQHHDSQRPQYSYFRYGLDLIRDLILGCLNKRRQLKQCFKQMIPNKIRFLQARC